MSPRGSSGCNQRSRAGSYGKKVGEGSMRRFQGAGGLSSDIKGVEWHRVVMLRQHVAQPH